MQHPFEGIVTSPADEVRHDVAPSRGAVSQAWRPTRRSFVGTLAAGLGLFVGWFVNQRPAVAQSGRFGAQGPFSSRPGGASGPNRAGNYGAGNYNWGNYNSGNYRSGGYSQSYRPTYPPSYPRGGGMTTQALGEEGGGYRPPGGSYTTYALGEEGGPGYYRPPQYYYRPGSRSYYPWQPRGYDGRPTRPGTVTTFALGEEG